MLVGFTSADSTSLRSKTVFLISGRESAVTEGQSYALFCAILCKGLEHTWIWVFVGVLSSADAEGGLKFWGNQVIRRFSAALGSAPLTPTLFKGQLYIQKAIGECRENEDLGLAL